MVLNIGGMALFAGAGEIGLWALWGAWQEHARGFTLRGVTLRGVTLGGVTLGGVTLGANHRRGVRWWSLVLKIGGIAFLAILSRLALFSGAGEIGVWGISDSGSLGSVTGA